MKEIKNEIEYAKDCIIFIHTPFCGTCQVARKMLETVEEMKADTSFLEMNASLFPTFMQQQEIASVPCLLIKKQGMIKERIYAFHSVVHILNKINEYE
ncbi:thioredoxin family protein [Aquibacillus koreensis]|uniref:Thioredoxin family protein n=1 Tax=Aquibacillus koreensis TaxID=279446 RepID=A0A9X4AHW9_9BACI|nr:thioredoxin family protein [Aquibacillus koreensis]MCT2535930.1 thioredoxin family protein [Aquibacillus koreensis]MDC3420386.1 thioredoxin family protein [Aquibacillus koreensis]